VRILFLTAQYPPNSLGGYEVACRACADGLRDRGHHVLVLTSNQGEATNLAPQVRRVLHRPQDTSSLIEAAMWEYDDHRTLRRAIADFRPEVISAWSLLNLFPSLHRPLVRLNVPVVYNLHDLWLPRHCAEGTSLAQVWQRPGSTAIRRVVKRGVLRFATALDPDLAQPLDVSDLRLDCTVFCSHFRQEQHKAAGLPLGRSRVIYNGVDTGHFTGPVAPRPAGSSLRLLFVGRLVAEKGLDTLLDAAALIAREGSVPFELTIAGIPSYPHQYAEDLRKRIGRSDVRLPIRFIDPVPHDRLPDVYRGHDVLVFPSTGPEGFPMTTLEAAACGLAIVGTATGGMGEFLEDGVTGLVVVPGDAAALAAAIGRLAADEELRARLAATVQQAVRERFDIRRTIDETAEYLQTLVA
jgi:glycogen(starch) synthase